jgi:hypothetical protein
MQFLAVKCPITGKFFSTKIETDPQTMVALPDDVRTRSHCSLCGRYHDWSAREAILANFLTKNAEPPVGEPPRPDLIQAEPGQAKAR